ncbi:hypothetical protein ACHWQZ_G013541 [Mnemiopsis leidyi]
MRVKSKKLFNFPLQGTVDGDVAQFESSLEKEFVTGVGKLMLHKMEELSKTESEASDKEFAEMIRGMIDPFIKQVGTHPALQECGALTTETRFSVPTTHHTAFSVPVHVYTPNTLARNSHNAAYIYAHGGGGVASTAALAKPWLDYIAVKCGVVVFNVDYRLSPEVKSPNNVLDFYECLKYIHSNASVLNIDPGKIAIAGECGGGYICLGTMVLLAQRDETNIVKLAMPGMSLIDDYCFSPPCGMTREERRDVLSMRKIWRLRAADLDSQWDDPVLFPGKTSDTLLEKFPPTIINEVEFDMFITETSRLANRLRRAGRLLEFVVIPGAKNGSNLNPEFKCFTAWQSAVKLSIEEYLQK